MTPADLELLTQAVDGELSDRDSRRLRRLLQVSEEARTLLAQLEADRALMLRVQPVAEPPGDLTQQILAKISRLPAPTPAVLHRPEPHRAWVPFAVAASLCLAAGSWFLAYSLRNTDPGGVAGQKPAPHAAQPAEAARQALPPEGGPLVARAPEESEPRAVTPPRLPKVEAPRPRPAPEVVAAPRPVPKLDNALTSPIHEAPAPFETIQVRLPLLMSLADVKDRTDALVRELDRDPAYRLDLFSKNPSKALEVFANAARSSGVTVHQDAVLRNKKVVPSAIVVYVECLTVAEVRDLLLKLAALDNKTSKHEFEMLHLAPAQAVDHRELKDVLGVDVGLWKRTDTTPATRPITAATGDAVARAVASGTASRGPEKPAMALAFQPLTLRSRPAASRELQQFLARRDRPAGSLSLMIVIRNH